MAVALLITFTPVVIRFLPQNSLYNLKKGIGLFLNYLK